MWRATKTGSVVSTARSRAATPTTDSSTSSTPTSSLGSRHDGRRSRRAVAPPGTGAVRSSGLLSEGVAAKVDVDVVMLPPMAVPRR